MEQNIYKVITWPKVQPLMECDGFFDNAYPILDENGMEMFGASAYFVNIQWLAKHCQNDPADIVKDIRTNCCTLLDLQALNRLATRDGGTAYGALVDLIKDHYNIGGRLACEVANELWHDVK